MENNFTDKSSFKMVNIKTESQNFKYLIYSFFTNPIKTLKLICTSKNSNYFNSSLIILFIWITLTFISTLFSYSYFNNTNYIFFSAIRDLTIPIISVGFISIIIYSFYPKKDEKLNLNNILTSTILCKIPIIFSSFISLLTIVSPNAISITKPIYYFCLFISTILHFFAIKYIYNETDDYKCFKYFFIIYSVFYIIYILLSFLDIYLI